MSGTRRPPLSVAVPTLAVWFLIRPGRPLPMQVVDDESMLVPALTDPPHVGVGRVEVRVGMCDDVRVGCRPKHGRRRDARDGQGAECRQGRGHPDGSAEAARQRVSEEPRRVRERELGGGVADPKDEPGPEQYGPGQRPRRGRLRGRRRTAASHPCRTGGPGPAVGPGRRPSSPRRRVQGQGRRRAGGVRAGPGRLPRY